MKLIPTNTLNKVATLLSEDDLYWTIKVRETYTMFVYESSETDVRIMITQDKNKIITTIEDNEYSLNYDIVESLTKDELQAFELLLETIKDIKETEEEKEEVNRELASYESESNVINLREVVKNVE